MTVPSLITNVKNNNPHSHFFDRDTLKFFGERISEMRVLKNPVSVTDFNGNTHNCWCLSSLQRNAPMGATRVYHYFDTKTFEEVRA